MSQYVAKMNGYYITEIANDHSVGMRNPKTIRSINSVMLFDSEEDMRSKVSDAFWGSIRLIKKETAEKFINSSWIVYANWYPCYVAKRTKLRIRMTGDPREAKRFFTKREAEKFIETLHPSDKSVKFYIENMNNCYVDKR